MMDIKVSRNYLIAFCGLSLLFLMMTFISQYNPIKMALMLALVVLIRKVPSNLSIKARVIFILIFMYGVYGIYLGFFYQNPHPFLFVTIYCIYPFFFALFSLFLTKTEYFIKIVQVIFFAHLFIVFYDLVYAWGVLVGVDIPNIYTVEIPFSIYSDSSRMNFVNLNTLTFTTPVLFLLLLAKYEIGISRIIQSIVLFATFFLLIISGRRSVMLMMFVLPFIPFVFSGFFSKKVKTALIRSTFIFLGILCIVFFKIKSDNPELIDGYSEVFMNAFDSGKEPIKFAQKEMLTQKFIEKPIFGQGSGAMFFEPAPGRMIFADQFELSYHYKLASTGIIGFILIVGTYLWVFFYGLYISRKNNDMIFLSFLIGYFFMLIADATNPVLASFDLIWPIYLCLARINYWEISKRAIQYNVVNI
ncbi:hypothetical protein IRZ83_10835 [Flavobacterium sp. JLP]|uniref:O-antigen ligase family protein n=1 Tax=Flavobacterium sp. JLP TaxID=2783793 RepID=UPI00188C8912|nr:hypothetical protein [Flavobacterium sp. JLP]MBF4507166.1 hypothetical protein [Flavobacterium sp. JLP]